MRKNRAILVLSCDKYSDLWEPFFDLFFKNWPTCPYKIYLESNKKKYRGSHKEKINNIQIGEDKDWSSSAKNTLNRIREDYLFVWMEDAFITSEINTEDFEKVFRLLESGENIHVHAKSGLRPRNWINNGDFGILERGMPYSINAVGFWRRKALCELLIGGESPWNFEIMGSYRSQYYGNILTLRYEIFHWVHIIDKGQWTFEGNQLLQAEFGSSQFKERAILSSSRFSFHGLKILYFNLVLNFSWRFRVRIMNYFRKIFISY